MSLVGESGIFNWETQRSETEELSHMNCSLGRRPTSSSFQGPWGCLGPDFSKLLALPLLTQRWPNTLIINPLSFLSLSPWLATTRPSSNG